MTLAAIRGATAMKTARRIIRRLAETGNEAQPHRPEREARKNKALFQRARCCSSRHR